MGAAELFEAELRHRKIDFTVQAGGAGYEIRFADRLFQVHLDNLSRQLDGGSHDVERVAKFVDAVVKAAAPRMFSAERLYWCLEPTAQLGEASVRENISPQVDRVLCDIPPDGSLISSVSNDDVSTLGMRIEQAKQYASTNLDGALRESQLSIHDVDGVSLGFFESDFVSKASLLLAANLRDVVAPVLGWPVLAVAPDRDFVYVWSAQHQQFAQRVGPVVVREYANSAYPLTTEVFEIGDSIHAVGAFQSPA